MRENEFPVTRKEAEKTGVEFSSEKNKNAPFPTRLRELRKEKGVSQQQCSEELGISKSAIGYWETGDTLPDAKSVAQMAEYYGVSADYLLGLSDVKSPDVDIRKICEFTGLTELAAKFLIMNNGLAQESEMGLLDDKTMEKRRLLDAVNALVGYQPFLLADIAEYLYFRFDHFETDSRIRIDTGKTISATGKYGDGSSYSIQVTGEKLADMKLLDIEKSLKDLRKDIVEKSDSIDTWSMLW